MYDKKITRPKVCFIQNIPTSYALPLFERLCDDSKWDLTVYFCGLSHADRYWNLVPKHPKIHVLKGWASRPQGIQMFTNHFNPGIIKEILTNNFDVVITGGYAFTTAFIAISLAKLKKIPYVINTETHTHASSNNGCLTDLRQRVRDKICHGARAFLVTGTRVRNYLTALGIPDECIFVFPNSCDVAWFSRQAARSRGEADGIYKKYDINTPYIVLYVGRLVNVKNVHTLIDAYSLLPGELREKTSLVLVGEGMERGALEEKALAMKLPNVKFVGHRQGKELVEFYAVSNIFVLLSTFEPWGVVVNEAAACSLPLILSRNVGAADDLLQEGENGFLVDALDPARVSTNIARILTDESLAKKMAERSRQIVENWTYDRNYEGFTKMLHFLGKLHDDGLEYLKMNGTGDN